MIALTIAGSDSGGGAGIQADLKTFQELEVFGTSAITALTAQNTTGVHGIFPMTPEFVAEQIRVVLEDFEVRAMKTGMLFSKEIIQAASKEIEGKHIPVIVDPVMIAKGGTSLLQEEAVLAIREKLLPLATVCTPNIPEAEVLSGQKIGSDKELSQAAQKILALGVKCVVMKGGHLGGGDAVDTVFMTDHSSFSVSTPRIVTEDTHGTGCTFSAALTANLAKGYSLKEAIIEAKKFVHLAISTPLHIGHGHGPTNHFAFNQANGECEVLVNES